MIAVKLMGGLGNQMFQYAVGRHLASSRQTSLVMDLGFFENTADIDTPRHYELDCFKLNANFLAAARRPHDPELLYSGHKGKLLLARDSLLRKAWRVYRESGFPFDPNVLKLPNNSYLIGYWQTEKYFGSIRETILEDFTFREPAVGRNKALLDEISHTEAVSLHVRRGDYVTNANANRFHGTKDYNYYDKALSLVLKKCRDATVYIFSDDIDWCKQNLRFDVKTIYVDGNEKGYEDLRLMQACKHNIIANSSFSWWGAWLNRNPNKIVVAPKVWFNDPTTDTSDITPKEWLKI